jgi:hypothetical protein
VRPHWGNAHVLLIYRQAGYLIRGRQIRIQQDGGPAIRSAQVSATEMCSVEVRPR